MSNEKEKAYNDWEAVEARTIQEAQAWDAGWEASSLRSDAAFESRPVVVETIRSVARQAERAEIRDRIIELAVEKFRCRLDETARTYRELADQLFGKLP